MRATSPSASSRPTTRVTVGRRTRSRAASSLGVSGPWRSTVASAAVSVGESSGAALLAQAARRCARSPGAAGGRDRRAKKWFARLISLAKQNFDHRSDAYRSRLRNPPADDAGSRRTDRCRAARSAPRLGRDLRPLVRVLRPPRGRGDQRGRRRAGPRAAPARRRRVRAAGARRRDDRAPRRHRRRRRGGGLAHLRACGAPWRPGSRAGSRTSTPRSTRAASTRRACSSWARRPRRSSSPRCAGSPRSAARAAGASSATTTCGRATTAALAHALRPADRGRGLRGDVRPARHRALRPASSGACSRAPPTRCSCSSSARTPPASTAASRTSVSTTSACG